MSRETQKELIYNLLLDKGEKFTPVFWFIGEKYCHTLNKWVFLSHRGPARLTDLYQEGKLERKLIKGRTGARYYEYRLKSAQPPKQERRKFPWEN